MSVTYYIVDFFVILAACLVAALVEDKYRAWKDKALDLGCDYCEGLRPLGRTPNKQHWLCRKCMEAFLAEHQNEFTEEQISKARRGYRRIRRKRGKK